MEAKALFDTLNSNLTRTALESHFEAQAHAVPCGGSTVLARVLDTYLMYLDMDDSSVAANLAIRGYWEFWVTRALVRELRDKVAGCAVVDAGANHGYFTLLLDGLVGSGGMVSAFEVQHSLVAKLHRTLALNGAGHCAICQHGLWDVAGEHRKLVSSPFDMGITHLGDEAARHGADPQYTTITTTLDDYLGGNSIRFMKIDCEGAEERIWKGMQRTLERSHDLEILMEFTPSLYEDAAGFEAAMRDRFDLFDVCPDSKLRAAPESLAEETPEFRMLWLKPKKRR